MKNALGFFLGVAAVVLAGNAESGEVVIGPGDSLPAAVTRARQAPVWLWGAGRCELISEYNQFLPADADLSGTGYGRMVADSDASAILEGIDPLPKESELGVRGGRDR